MWLSVWHFLLEFSEFGHIIADMGVLVFLWLSNIPLEGSCVYIHLSIDTWGVLLCCYCYECVCALMICAHMCVLGVCECSYVKRLSSMSNISLNQFSILHPEIDPHWTWSSLIWLDCLASEPRILLPPPHQWWGDRDLLLRQLLYLGTGDPSSAFRLMWQTLPWLCHPAPAMSIWIRRLLPSCVLIFV